MNEQKLIESSGKSLFIQNRGIPKGCELCLKGAKTVLFLNGICQLPDHCSWYCPISEERRGHIDTYANEIKITKKNELLEEIKTADSEGISITGGEPLNEVNLEKTLDYIRFVKKTLGKKFHVHLYTNSMNFSPIIANNLEEVGLDEIRFHPPPDKWDFIKYALNTNMVVGAELPLIPEKDYIQNLKKFILYLDSIGTSFINLNEFEYCFPNSARLKERGFILEQGTIASVEGSKKMGENLIKDLLPSTSLKIHFCKIITKDFYQLKNRYFRRAKYIKKPYEEITEEGLLLHAEISGDKKNVSKFISFLKLKTKIPSKLIEIDQEIVKLPYYLVIDKLFSKILDKYDLEANIIEKTPFREPKYQQITEKTPLNIFKEEYEFYED
ncbi:MAG: 4Fe-4S cluster-binding domain-containing protein [Promethearchaeota archaeon]|nr:MAG: 4Fe-4S cluster-binding domain-containing protein [Candidatus Lokiarchaeota archaeon]